MKTIPRLRPGQYTAMQVLQHVYKLIRQEPKRLNMRDWVSAFKGILLDRQLRKNQIPECGTAACVAGWICISTRLDGFSGSLALDKMGLYSSVPNFEKNEQKRQARITLRELFIDVGAKPKQVLARLQTIMQEHPILSECEVMVGQTQNQKFRLWNAREQEYVDIKA